MTFVPFTGFDPCDGDDPRVSPSRDNPLYASCGKQVLRGTRHVADAADPVIAESIVAALNFHSNHNEAE